jgi:hypothetical protein
VSADGTSPKQSVCAADTVLLPITGFMVICTAAEVSTQPPDDTILLYQVVAVNADGAWFCAVADPPATP